MRPFSAMVAGELRARNWPRDISDQLEKVPRADLASANSENPLARYFESHQDGRGILKWLHYFDIYHRYFQKFVGKEVHVVEIGIFSGGSLDMWKEYFGPNCRIYGVDIQEECKAYEDARTKIFVGDQGDRAFWQSFKRSVPRVDIVIDDGGHLPHQQMVTLEEMLPHVRPGGVFLCEDIHGVHQGFTAYSYGLADRLNAYATNKEGSAIEPSEFQRSIHAVHLYPYVTVIEKADSVVDQFVCPGRGTEWAPFPLA